MNGGGQGKLTGDKKDIRTIRLVGGGNSTFGKGMAKALGYDDIPKTVLGIFASLFIK